MFTVKTLIFKKAEFMEKTNINRKKFTEKIKNKEIIVFKYDKKEFILINPYFQSINQMENQLKKEETQNKAEVRKKINEVIQLTKEIQCLI